MGICPAIGIRKSTRFSPALQPSPETPARNGPEAVAETDAGQRAPAAFPEALAPPAAAVAEAPEAELPEAAPPVEDAAVPPDPGLTNQSHSLSLPLLAMMRFGHVPFEIACPRERLKKAIQKGVLLRAAPPSRMPSRWRPPRPFGPRRPLPSRPPRRARPRPVLKRQWSE